MTAHEMIYIPGHWRCGKCGLYQINKVLSAVDGTTGPNDTPQQCPNGCGPLWRATWKDNAIELQERLEKADARVQHLESLINTPEIMDFLGAVNIEAAHQRERWGEDHDKNKSPEEWLWVVCYLVTKATQAHRYGDQEKYLHHIITAAAAMANWHRLALAEFESTKATEPQTSNDQQ